jgi:hypothetical protein
MPNRKLMLRLLGIAIALLALSYMLRQLWLSWEQLRGLTIQPVLAAAAVLSGMIALGNNAISWRGILLGLQQRLSISTSLRVWFFSQMVRYVPGNVWHLFGRLYLSQQAGVNTRPASLSLILEVLYTLTAGLLVAALSLVFWPRLDIILVFLLLLIPFLGLCLVPQLFQRPLIWLLRRLGRSTDWLDFQRRDTLKLLPIYGISWLYYGLGLHLLALSIYPLPIQTLPAVIGMFALGWIIGFLSIITPSGLGVREGVLSYLLTFVMPEPVAILLALLARVWLLAAELVCLALITVWSRLAPGEPAV